MVPSSHRHCKKGSKTAAIMTRWLFAASILLCHWQHSATGAAVVAKASEETFSLPVVPPQETTHKSNDESLLEELDSFVREATLYLIRISHTEDQDRLFPGRFTYQADLRKSLHPTLQKGYWNHESNHQFDYNLLRHNGAIYALTQAYHRNEQKLLQTKTGTKHELEKLQEHILDTIRRGIGYLRDNALLPVPKNEALLAAWERKDIDDPHSEPETAKLGGAGLALIALGNLERIVPNSVSLEKELSKLGAFVEYLQNPKDGSFTCKYEWRTGPNDEWTSLYYPGEAALGLVTLAQLDDSQKHRWIAVASKALLYLEGYRRDQDLQDIEPDHWALLATSKLLPMLLEEHQKLPEGSIEQKQAELEYWLIYQHGVKVATSMVKDHSTKGLQEHDGCFTYDGRTCPTSTRLEGLLAAMTFVQESEVFYGGDVEDEEEEGSPHFDATELLLDRIEKDVHMGIRFLLTAQEKNHKNGMNGGIPGKYTSKVPSSMAAHYHHHHETDDEEGSEDEDFDRSEVRVDYVQHSMSAVMAYEAFLKNKAQKARKGLHQVVHEKVHKVADPIIHHVRKKMKKASRSSTVLNYALLAALLLFLIGMVKLTYCPKQSKRHRHRGQNHKRSD